MSTKYKDLKGATSGFKKNMRVALQLLGFNTVEPTVHANLLKKSIKRMADTNLKFKQKVTWITLSSHTNSLCSVVAMF